VLPEKDVVMSSAEQRRAAEIVKAVGAINFQGNIIPHLWYRTLRASHNKLDPNGKPQLAAIVVLSELVYWYRPRVQLDPQTGQIVSIHKRFPDDKLRRSMPSLQAKFGLSYKQVRDALDFLADEVGVITREIRTIGEGDDRRGNVLFLEIVPEVLRRITLPEAIDTAPKASEQIDSDDLSALAAEIPSSALEGAPSALEGRASVIEGRASALEGRGSDLEDRASALYATLSAPEGEGSALQGTSSAPGGQTLIEINRETMKETQEESTTNDESRDDETAAVVVALQDLGLSKFQAIGAATTHQLSLDDVDRWATWVTTLRGVKNPIAVLAATIKQQARPPQAPTTAAERSDDPNKYISGALSDIVKS